MMNSVKLIERIRQLSELVLLNTYSYDSLSLYYGKCGSAICLFEASQKGLSGIGYLPMKVLQQKEVLNVVRRASGTASTVISGVSLGYTACTGKFDKFIKEAGVAGCLMELSFYCPYTWAIGLAYGIYTIWSEMESE